ncbi:zinc finger protein OZF-like [Ruditapes philippinarum]|uniref:zinc finger protein OZF-like n=1 Tax=Ruditapes philippinarum TaxID=129788 RepID=UPI00295B6510|nr:zinc finger protein OZF-like [Ruditapes philippinarum]
MTSSYGNAVNSFEKILETVKYEENFDVEDDSNYDITSDEETDEHTLCFDFDTEFNGHESIHQVHYVRYQGDDVGHQENDVIHQEYGTSRRKETDAHVEEDAIQEDAKPRRQSALHKTDDVICKGDIAKRKRDFKKQKSVENKCGICHKSFKRRYLLVQHMSLHTGECNYECVICKERFRLKKYLYKHMSRHKDDKQYKCQVCQKSYDSLKLFNDHTNIHRGIRYQCKYCEKSFSASSSLKVHLKLHAEPGSSKLNYYVCNICKKSFASESSLRMHMEIHNGTQNQICNICDARFSRKHDLQRHMFIHTGEKPYKCSLCLRAFRQPGELGRHMAWHRGDHKQSCKQCGRKYARKDEFLRHISTHEKELNSADATTNKLQCNVCKKFLTSEIKLQQHLEKHTREVVTRKCEECGTIFSTSSNYKRHVRDKHNQKQDGVTSPNCSKTTEDITGPFKCDLCSKILKTKHTLIAHMNNVHLNKHSFVCYKCDKTFFKKKDLIMHEERKHKNLS